MNWTAIQEWFTRDYDSFKKIIVIGGIVNLVIFILFLYQYQANKELISAMHQGERDLKSLYRIAHQISAIRKELKDDALSDANADISAYIKNQAYVARIGDLDIIPGRPDLRKQQGYEDRHYIVKPSDRNRPLSREQIVTFLHRIESNTARARVTSINLRPPPKGFSSGKPREDEWSMEAMITSRSRIGKCYQKFAVRR